MNQIIADNFKALCAIPHKSKHEEKISLYLYDRAKKHGLEVHRDEIGNIIIDKPAAPGFENAPLTILQAHMDMVVVWEEGKEFDPLNDPIEVVMDGTMMRANGTSLGGDDGSGIALAQAILEDNSLVLGPVRAIFTVDEEDGMSGADNLDAKWLNGKYLVNLDWEEFGSLCCSSAGGELYTFRQQPDWQSVESGVAYAIHIEGLSGGHSGAMIHLNRANAIRVAAGLVDKAAQAGIAVRIASFTGGVAHNAIPSVADITLVVPDRDTTLFKALVCSAAAALKEKYALSDPDAQLFIDKTDLPQQALTAECTAAFAGFVANTHDGVNTMSAAIPTLVETSANLGMILCSEEALGCDVFQRGSNDAVTAQMRASYAADAEKYGCKMAVVSSYPGWPVRENSRLMDICTGEYKKMYGEDMKVEPVHAGLECGNFSTKAPELDIISIGPNIYDIHSPAEAMDMESVDKLYDLVLNILKVISEE